MPDGTEIGPRHASPGLLALAFRRPWFTLAVAIVFGAAVTGYVSRLPDEYSSTGILSIEPLPGPDLGAGTDVVRLVGPSYVEYATAPATLRQLAAELGLSGDQLRAAIETTLVRDTGLLRVTATASDPELAVTIASTVGQAIARVVDEGGLVRGRLIAPPVRPRSPSGPPRRLMVLLGTLVGAGAALGAAGMLERQHPGVHTRSEVERATGAPMLARVHRPRLGRYGLGRHPRPRLPASVALALVQDTRADHVVVVLAPVTASVTSAPRLGAVLAESLRHLDKRAALLRADRPDQRQWSVFEVDGRVDEPSPRETPTDRPATRSEVWAWLRSVVGERDYLVVEGPSVPQGHLGQVLALAADRVILVVTVGTRQAFVQETATTLRGLGVRPFGVLLT